MIQIRQREWILLRRRPSCEQFLRLSTYGALSRHFGFPCCVADDSSWHGFSVAQLLYDDLGEDVGVLMGEGEGCEVEFDWFAEGLGEEGGEAALVVGVEEGSFGEAASCCGRGSGHCGKSYSREGVWEEVLMKSECVEVEVKLEMFHAKKRPRDLRGES